MSSSPHPSAATGSRPQEGAEARPALLQQGEGREAPGNARRRPSQLCGGEIEAEVHPCAATAGVQQWGFLPGPIPSPGLDAGLSARSADPGAARGRRPAGGGGGGAPGKDRPCLSRLCLLGISHHTAPLELREPLALPQAELPRALELLGLHPQVREGMIVSTCNRVEVVVVPEDGAQPDLFAFLAAAAPQACLPPRERFYAFSGDQAVRHLFRVAASLDSLVLGEPQILGQLKHAYSAAREAGLVGAGLEAVLPQAFHAAKRVRSETAIAALPVSVSQTAVDLARQIFGSLEHKTVLLLGAGAMGAAAARYLLDQGAHRLLVVNRTLAHARVLADKFAATAHALQELPELGGLADVIIACTGAPQPLITRTLAARFLAFRHGRPMLFLDLAVPRDVEPSVHQLENAFAYNVDDLDQVVSANLQERRQAAEQGEAIIAAECEAWQRRHHARDLSPTLRALQQQAEAVRAAEFERLRKRLGPLTREQEQAVEDLTRSLMQKWLHHPMVELKQSLLEAASADERRRLLELVDRLFALPAPLLPEPSPESNRSIPERPGGADQAARAVTAVRPQQEAAGAQPPAKTGCACARAAQAGDPPSEP